MINNEVNNQIKVNRLFSLCRYIAIVFGVILLSTWTVKSASLENLSRYKFQQDAFLEITGIDKTEQGDPIPGAVVLKVGTNQGTDTDVEGKYSLNVNEGDKIQFVYEGFKTSMATVRRSNILNVKMIKNDTDLPDVIISINYHLATGCTIDSVRVKKT
ncbi:carboxypeptidase-like regulatory domain-containing protein [Paenimyroides aestuarii]|uniref:Carboxypeptidase-like regulatory domain-containing protein n=1 Tax=Paenimyroides aestuarii TaxID=2968490 RepID=A0ABY5NUC1_9FLAO|nr:carboxypeptidase-like regulatory domain-containing protein [Paenimyroides aestuarii]UUV22052.1 carboxypeptidase-like regulatory domain-containing protein [Paenimyroides aestuarii]